MTGRINLASSVLTYWKKKYLSKGKDGLKVGYKRIERGMKASTHTPIGDGCVENAYVVDQIRAVLNLDYCVYGY